MEKAEGKAEKKLAKKRKMKDVKAKEVFEVKPRPGVFGKQRIFPSKSMEVAKVQVLRCSRLQGSLRGHVSSAGRLATGGVSVHRLWQVVCILWLIVSMWGLRMRC